MWIASDHQRCCSAHRCFPRPIAIMFPATPLVRVPPRPRQHAVDDVAPPGHDDAALLAGGNAGSQLNLVPGTRLAASTWGRR